MANSYGTGHGASITFGTSGFAAPIRVLGTGSLTREKVPYHDLSDSRMSYVPAGVSSPGDFTLEFLFDFTGDLETTDIPDIDHAAETVTVTFPDFGFATPATLAGSGFFTEVVLPEMASDALAVGSATVAWSGGDDSPAFSDAES